MRRFLVASSAWLLWTGSVPAHAIPLPRIPGIPKPELVSELGRSFLVDGPADGVFDQGGFSTTLSVLWPVDDRWRFGLSLYADEAGSWQDDLAALLRGSGGFLESGQLRMTDAEIAALAGQGDFEFGHVNLYGCAWRLESVGPRIGRFETFARGSFGFYQIHVDLTGTYLGSETNVGWGAGGGALLPLSEGHAVGLSVAYDRVLNDYFTQYMSAALTWRWRPSVKPAVAPPVRR